MAVQIQLVVGGVALLVVGLVVGGVANLSRETGEKKLGTSSKTTECSRSLSESDGFYCMPDDEWNERVDAVRRRAEKQCGRDQECCKDGPKTTLPNWYRDCFEPEWSCVVERIGRTGDGGKWICEVDKILRAARKRNEPCLIYSFGSNGDYSFETKAHERMKECEIFTFDPTVDLRWRPPPEFIHFVPWGLGPKDGVNASDVFGKKATPGSMMYRLRTAMKLLGHENREIDILKIDIEGSEYDAFNDFFEDDFLPFRQIQIELHKPQRSGRLHAQLRRHGYVITHKEPNYAWFATLQELAFLRLSRNFFKDVVPDPHVIPLANQLDDWQIKSTRG
uniref:Methyltransferase domain-containing protein n=1 Tax=Erythrolobus madagascarensis TaxID=708628 RepID=A0A7S0T5M1_9RHOD|mmetsp:Transcript_3736/g.8223  ORF Transcript_3736/g.8223 Transcript_3736/m.8223 type:complete len:335 (+) Transcript_3736:15-1019(+)